MIRPDSLGQRIRTVSGMLAGGAALPADQRAGHAALQMMAGQVDELEREHVALRRMLDDLIAQTAEDRRAVQSPTSDATLMRKLWPHLVENRGTNR